MHVTGVYKVPLSLIFFPQLNQNISDIIPPPPLGEKTEFFTSLIMKHSFFREESDKGLAHLQLPPTGTDSSVSNDAGHVARIDTSIEKSVKFRTFLYWGRGYQLAQHFFFQLTIVQHIHGRYAVISQLKFQIQQLVILIYDILIY